MVNRLMLRVGLLVLVVTACSLEVFAQPQPAPGVTTPIPVVIKRDAVSLVMPSEYGIAVVLKPSKQVSLASTLNGQVSKVRHRLGDLIRAQEESVKLDSREAELMLDKANAYYEGAKLEVDRLRKLADSGAVGAEEVRQADMKARAANIDLDLARLQLQSMSIRSPFDGVVTKVHVVTSQIVRSGEPLITISDMRELIAEIPVDRTHVKVGDQLEVMIETVKVTGRVEALTALPAEFSKLRDLVASAALAIVSFDNRQDQLAAGQMITPEIIPVRPVVLANNQSVSNDGQGNQKVQVLRDGMVRDLKVTVMGTQGETESYLSGAFQVNDEIIIESTATLQDGTIVRPASEAIQQPESSRRRRQFDDD